MSRAFLSLSAMPRYLLYFSYMGKNYRGIQKQFVHNAGPAGYIDFMSVQGMLEAALSKLAVKPTITKMSSRTDAGVHALMNTGEVDLTHPKPGEMFSCDTVMKVLNTHLEGEDIRVFKVRIVPEYFHCRTYVRNRTYLYRMAVVNPEKDPDRQFFCHEPNMQSALPSIEYGRCYAFRGPFNFLSAKKAAGILNGVHNFKNFVGALQGREKLKDESDYVREINVRFERAIPLMDETVSPLYSNLEFFHLYASSRAFLYNQVRRIAAVIAEVGKGRIELAEIKRMLDRPEDGWHTKVHVAPPYGLYLQNVEYEECDLTLPDDYLLDKYGIGADRKFGLKHAVPVS